MAVKVAVLGGGNGGHAAAADLSNRGFCVHMYEDARFAGNIKKVFDTHEITLAGAAGNATVKIDMVTSDLREAIQDVEFIFVAVPAFAHDVYARALAELVHPRPDCYGDARYLRQSYFLEGIQEKRTGGCGRCRDKHPALCHPPSGARKHVDYEPI